MKKVKLKKLAIQRETLTYLDQVIGGANSGWMTCVSCNNGSGCQSCNFTGEPH